MQGEKRRRMDGEEERNVLGAWMRGEERKNGSTKGREENRGLAAQTRSIRPLPPTSPLLPRQARGRTERNLIPTRTHRYTTESSRFFLSTLRASLSLFFAPSATRCIHLSIFFHPSRSRRSAILRGNVLPFSLDGSISSQ